MNDIIIDIDNKKEICSACGKEFILRASYQTIDVEKGIYVCSMRCKNSLAERRFKRETCINCNKSFFVEHSYQQIKIGETSLYFCSLNCKNEATAAITVSNTREKHGKVRKIAIFTQKGGTGKTTTAVNIALGLHKRHYRVLLIDGDPQGSITDSLDIMEPHGRLADLFDLKNPKYAKDVILRTKINENPDLILSGPELNIINIELAKVDKNRHKILTNKLKNVESEYDFIIIDCSPALSILNQNVLYFVDEILIPISCDYLSLASLPNLLSTIKDIEDYFKHKLFLLGILPTFYLKNQKASKDVYERLKKNRKDKIFSPIPEAADIRLSAKQKEAVVNYKNRRGYASYNELINRIIKTIPKKEE